MSTSRSCKITSSPVDTDTRESNHVRSVRFADALVCLGLNRGAENEFCKTALWMRLVARLADELPLDSSQSERDRT